MPMIHKTHKCEKHFWNGWEMRAQQPFQICMFCRKHRTREEFYTEKEKKKVNFEMMKVKTDKLKHIELF